MKRIIIICLTFFFLHIQNAIACDVCRQNQPKVLQNITHGTGAQSSWDYVIIWIAIVIVSITLFLSVKYLVKPREHNPSHIKNIVVQSNL